MLMKRTALLPALMILLSSAVYAQENQAEQEKQEETVLPKVIVSDQFVETITPSAKSMRKALDKTPGGTNLVETTAIVGSKHTLRDILDYQPGIMLQDFFGGNDQPILNIRGSGVQSRPLSRGVMFLENGLPLNEADGSFIIGTLEARDTGFVAARRGANAMNPASDSLGGELDFYNLTGREETGKISAQYGSFATGVARAAFGKADEKKDFHISASGSRSNGFRSHSDQERYAIRANAGFALSNFENRTWLSYTDLKFDIPGPMRLDMVYNDPTANINDSGLFVSTTDPNRATSQWRIANRSKIQTGRFSHDLGLYVQETDDVFTSPTTVNDRDITTYGAQYRFENTRDDVLNYGAAFSWARTSMDSHYSPNKRNPMVPIQTLKDTYYDATAQHISAQLDGSWQFIPNWRLVGVLRYVETKRDIDAKNDGVSHDYRWNWWSPKLGVAWTPTPRQTFFANVSTTREAPVIGDIIQFKPPPPPPARMQVTELEAQKVINYEVGARGGFTEMLDWDVTLYRADIEKELLSFSPDGVTTYSTNYDGKTRHQGIELGLNAGWQLSASGKLEGRLSYMFSDFTFRDGVFSGNKIGSIPRHMISAQISYLRGAWRAEINSRSVLGNTHPDHSNLAHYGGYTIWGARLYYELGKHLSFFVQGDNLTDKRYVSSASTTAIGTATGAHYFSGNGRSASVGLDMTF